MSLVTRLGVVTGALLVLMVIASLLLLNETRVTAKEFGVLLERENHQAQLVLQMQVAFKQQVQEWKDILLRGTNPSDLATYTQNFQQADTEVDSLYERVLATEPDPELQRRLQHWHELEVGTDTAYTRALQIVQETKGQGFRDADRLVRGVDRPPTEALGQIVADRQAVVARRTGEVEAAARARQQVTLGVAALLTLLLAGAIAVALTRIVRPLRRLTREAEEVAHQRLPEAIRVIKAMEVGADPPTLPPFTVRTNDEVADLGNAFTRLQESALALALEQHRNDRETAEMLINLGRRNQNLLGRMLSYVTELERREQDPEVLSQLFRLDHATTRIRRNAESMLVLAGANQTRTWSRPVPVIDVVRAALSEVEEYIRVDLHHVEEGQVHGAAVADVVHLIAELVENATHFSPPTTQVTVIGQSVREGYRLRVIDQGVGMTRRELDEANQRIRDADANWSDARLLGLYVVGRLARRRRIRVTLEASAGRGITATVLLPGSLLSGRSAGSELLPSAASLLDPPSVPGVGLPTGGPGVDVVDLRGADDVRGSGASPGAAERGGLVPAGVPVQWPGDDADGPSARFPAARPEGGEPRLGSPTSAPTSGSRVGPFPGSTGHGSTGNGVTARPSAAPPSSAVPRRVRGAQLPDLGPIEERDVARPDEGPGAPESLRWQLRSFQLDVQAARRAIDEHGDGAERPDQLPTDHADEYAEQERRPEGER